MWVSSYLFSWNQIWPTFIIDEKIIWNSKFQAKVWLFTHLERQLNGKEKNKDMRKSPEDAKVKLSQFRFEMKLNFSVFGALKNYFALV